MGFETAKLYLDAHEAGLLSTDAGKAMDLANNQAGILAAETLKRTGKISAASIEEEAIKQLKAEKLIVLKPGNGLRGTK